MATRRQCLKRKKKRRLSERSEFPTLPVSGAGGACTPRSGAPSSGSPFLAYFFWRSKRSRSVAGTNSRLVPTTVQSQRFTSHQHVVLSPCFKRSNTATACDGFGQPFDTPA